MKIRDNRLCQSQSICKHHKLKILVLLRSHCSNSKVSSLRKRSQCSGCLRIARMVGVGSSEPHNLSVHHVTKIDKQRIVKSMAQIKRVIICIANRQYKSNRLQHLCWRRLRSFRGGRLSELRGQVQLVTLHCTYRITSMQQSRFLPHRWPTSSKPKHRSRTMTWLIMQHRGLSKIFKIVCSLQRGWAHSKEIGKDLQRVIILQLQNRWKAAIRGACSSVSSGWRGVLAVSVLHLLSMAKNLQRGHDLPATY